MCAVTNVFCVTLLVIGFTMNGRDGGDDGSSGGDGNGSGNSNTMFETGDDVWGTRYQKKLLKTHIVRRKKNETFLIPKHGYEWTSVLLQKSFSALCLLLYRDYLFVWKARDDDNVRWRWRQTTTNVDYMKWDRRNASNNHSHTFISNSNTFSWCLSALFVTTRTAPTKFY